MNVGIIGAAGLIGKQRLKSLEELKQMGYIIDNIYLYDIVPIVSDKYVSDWQFLFILLIIIGKIKKEII